MSHISCVPYSVPYNVPIACTLCKGRSIIICGVPRCNATRFSFNFVCGSKVDSDDIAFHFDVRFNFGSSHCTVVRNSRICGQWGSEESCSPCFPFSINCPFEIKICAKSNKFKIYVNNCHFIDFHYRIPVHRITHLNINGDVNLSQVVL
ncbi:Galectin-4 [Bulinus truncatus]|nr:Galectin-4 [Bulinus truncatus]